MAFNLAQLHEVLQASFGIDSHLHQFNIGGIIYGAPEFDDDGFSADRILDRAAGPRQVRAPTHTDNPCTQVRIAGPPCQHTTETASSSNRPTKCKAACRANSDHSSIPKYLA